MKYFKRTRQRNSFGLLPQNTSNFSHPQKLGKCIAKFYFNTAFQLPRGDGAERVATTQLPLSTDSLFTHLCRWWHFDFLYCRTGVEPSTQRKERLTTRERSEQPNIIAVPWGQTQSVFRHFSNVFFKYLTLPEASVKCSQCFHYVAVVTTTKCVLEAAENVLLHALNRE